MSLNKLLRTKLARAVATMVDPRLKRQQRHNFVDIVAIAICSTLAGGETFVDMEEFAKSKIEWLRSFLQLPNGAPSHDTFGRVMGMIDPLQIYDCFQSWTQELAQAIAQAKLIAVDGKCLKGSKGPGQNPLWLVSAWASEAKAVLGQVQVSKKSNEISALPELLDLLDIEGAIITADALLCQQDIARKIIEMKGHYVLALKGNQKKLREAAAAIFQDTSIDQGRFDIFSTQEKSHGRKESRDYITCSGPEVVQIGQDLGWPGLQTIAMAISIRIGPGGKKSEEIRYYISSLPGSAQALAKAIRSHWSIENSLHWVLDVAFDEDGCKVRDQNAAANLGAIRRFCLFLLRKCQSSKVGIAIRRRKAAWDTSYIEKILSLA